MAQVNSSKCDGQVVLDIALAPTPETTLETKEEMLASEHGIVGTRESFKDIELPAIRDEKGLGVREIKYIPLDLARDKVEAAAQDLARVKAEHIRLVHELERCHNEIHDDTKHYYTSFLEKLRDKAVSTVKQYKILLKNAEYGLAQHQQQAKEKEEALEDHMADLLTENQSRIQELTSKFKDERKKLDDERASLLREQVHEIERREKEFEERIAREERLRKQELGEKNEQIAMMIEDQYSSNVLREQQPNKQINQDASIDQSNKQVEHEVAMKEELERNLKELQLKHEKELQELARLRKIVEQNSHNDMQHQDSNADGSVTDRTEYSTTGTDLIESKLETHIPTLQDIPDDVASDQQALISSIHNETKAETETPSDAARVIQQSTSKGVMLEENNETQEASSSIDTTEEPKPFRRSLADKRSVEKESQQQKEDMDNLLIQLEAERQKSNLKDEQLRRTGSALASKRNETKLLRQRLEEMKKLTEEKAVEISKLGEETQQLTQRLKDAEERSKAAKTEVRNWVSSFQAEHKRAPQKADMQKVKPKYVAVKQADDDIKTLKNELSQKQTCQAESIQEMAMLKERFVIPAEVESDEEEGVLTTNDQDGSEHHLSLLSKSPQAEQLQLELLKVREELKDSKTMLSKNNERLDAEMKSKLEQTKFEFQNEIQTLESHKQQVERELNDMQLKVKLLVAKTGPQESAKDSKSPEQVVFEEELSMLRTQLKDSQNEANKAKIQLNQESLEQQNELEALRANLEQTKAELNRVQHDSSTVNHEHHSALLSAKQNEVIAKDSEIAKLLKENAMLKESRHIETDRSDNSATSFEDVEKEDPVAIAKGTGKAKLSDGVSQDDKVAFDQAIARAQRAETTTKELESKVKELQNELKSANKAAGGDGSAATKRFMEKAKAAEKKLKESESKFKEMKTKANRLEKDLEKAKAATSVGGLNNSGDAVKLKKELDNIKKRMEKALEEAEKTANKELKISMERANAAEKSLFELEDKHEILVAESKQLRTKIKEVDALKQKVAELEEKAELLEATKQELKDKQEELAKVDGLYKEEQALRKKYFNMMEDMKGKIRVYARCRPFAQYEIDNGSKQAVKFPDECTVVVDGQRGEKTFVYDQCFSPSSTQDEVFEDTRNLIQSSFDGFNVCVFAYGQTGSGKTFTMVGTPEMPGLVRRSITEIFNHREKNKAKFSLTVRVFIMELYLDNLVDLLFKVRNKGTNQQPPKLEIKKNKSGIVFVKGCEEQVVESAAELLKVFEQANAVRKVASTQMNAGSSRSHLIFSVLLENTDLASKKTTLGKLSLVDLAGSERQEKTGASGDQLKEAMSINKSLAALGDVISALSSNEKFIPYRNNKLTQLMSDSLGGNAKTLMFVNISPADYNAEETLSSLVYASRVKLITNSADKKAEDEEVVKLRKAIAELKASGGTSAILDEMDV